MAVYMSPNRQRRRLALVAVVAVLIGVIIGFVLGRATATSADDEVAASRVRGGEVAAALRTLPIEYEQLRAGTGGKSQAAFDDAVQRIVDQLTKAVQRAPWLGPSARDDVVGAAEDVQRAAAARATPESFRQTVEAAAATVEDAFDAKSPSGGAS